MGYLSLLYQNAKKPLLERNGNQPILKDLGHFVIVRLQRAKNGPKVEVEYVQTLDSLAEMAEAVRNAEEIKDVKIAKIVSNSHILDPGGAAPIKSGVASLRMDFLRDPYCVGRAGDIYPHSTHFLQTIGFFFHTHSTH